MEIISIILAAGKGKRMNSSLPKPLHKVAGKSLLHWLEGGLDEALVSKRIFVLGDKSEILKKHIKNSDYVIQEPQLGTGHAVKIAGEKISNLNSIILIVYADTPFISPKTIKKIIRKIENGCKISILGFETDSPNGYGRIITNQSNQVLEIIEDRDASEEVKKVKLCNSGILAGRAKDIFDYLEQVKLSNNGEYYLTDIVSICSNNKKKIGFVLGSSEELIGVNDRIDLSNAEKIIQKKLKNTLLSKGVTLVDPSSVYVSHNANLAKDVIIEPNVFIGPNVKINSNTLIRSFSYLENCSIGKKCNIGPFARIRPETEIEDNVRIGNFVEVKKSKIKNNSKVNHLSYIGDALVGHDSNVGAGTITCNYDGTNKHKTNIGNNVFIGSNSALIAPLTIKDNAIIAAGSTITKDVNANSIAVERSTQKEVKRRDLKFKK